MHDDNKILTKFVKKALVKQPSVNQSDLHDGISHSKIVTSPTSSSMTPHEVSKDVSAFNTWRNMNEKSMVSPSKVLSLAEQMQQDHHSVDAKKREAEFRKQEEKRQEAAKKEARAEAARAEINERIDETKKKRDDATQKLISKSHTDPSQEERVKDMAID